MGGVHRNALLEEVRDSACMAGTCGKPESSAEIAHCEVTSPASSQKLDFRLDDGQLTVGARVFDAADGFIIGRHNWLFVRKQLWIVCRGVKVELIQYRCHLDVRVLC